MYPKITIITPSYSQGQYIEQTITSILNQNYPNLEYIIIDGGSIDKTVDIIKKYEKHIAYWISEPDEGQAHAINKGLQKATGDLVNWINSDDYLEPGALHAIAKAYTKHSRGEVFGGYTHCFWEETGKTSHTYRMGLKKNATKTLLNIEMNQPGTFYKTEIIKTLGGINESLRYVFDNELWMRYLCQFGQKNVVLLKDLLAHFRQHGGSKSIGEGFELFDREQWNILWRLAKQVQLPQYLIDKLANEVHTDQYSSSNWAIENLNINEFEAWFDNRYMITLYNEGAIKESKKALINCIKGGYFRFNRKNWGFIKKNILHH